MARVKLSQHEILAAAAEIVDTEGVDGLSVQRVAATLETTPSALYNHVDGLDDIRRGLSLLGTAQLAEALRDAAIGRSGDDAVTAIATTYRDFAEEHSGLYAFTLLPPAPDDDERLLSITQIIDLIARIVERYGYNGEDAVHAARALRAAIHGFVALEATHGFVRRADIDASFEHLLGLMLSGLHDQVPAKDE